MKYKDLIKNNLKFIILMIVIITLGIIGITFALRINTFKPIGIDITTSSMGANITYLDGSSSTITSNNKLMPVNDVSNEVTNNTVSDAILKINFKLSGLSTNPDNTIMDISLNNINMDCNLKDEYFKWKLYKNGNKISEGNFSPTFDSLVNNRMLLTNTQEDLTMNEDSYSLIIYLAEKCTGDIENCSNEEDQSYLLNRSFSATIKIELSTGSKKTNVRTTSTEAACGLTSISIPECNTNIYNGSSRTLINNGTGYRLTNNTGIDAGNYAIVVKLQDGYKWNDNTTDNKVINCNISKKSLTIKASNQTISYGNSITNSTSKVTTNGLISGHTLSYIYLSTEQYNTGTGVITASAAQVKDSNGTDVTSNYDITYQTGTVTIS